MDFSPSARAAEFTKAVRSFIRDELAPVERGLRRRARAQGLWNLFLPAGHEGPYAERFGTHGGTGLTDVDDAPIAGAAGWSFPTGYRAGTRRGGEGEHRRGSESMLSEMGCATSVPATSERS
jgi:acyl-CoA dehydrogenase